MHEDSSPKDYERASGGTQRKAAKLLRINMNNFSRGDVTGETEAHHFT